MIKKNNNKKIKEAAALKFSPERDGAPKLVAIGKGEIAEKILDAAKEGNVPLYRDEGLAHMLNRLQIGDEIPPALYEVVAEILVFVNSMDKAYGEKNGSTK